MILLRIIGGFFIIMLSTSQISDSSYVPKVDSGTIFKEDIVKIRARRMVKRAIIDDELDRIKASRGVVEPPQRGTIARLVR